MVFGGVTFHFPLTSYTQINRQKQVRSRETKNWLHYNGPEEQSEVEYLQHAHKGKIKKAEIFLAWGEKNL